MQNKQAKAAHDAGFTHILISGMLQKSFLCLKKKTQDTSILINQRSFLVAL